MSTGGNTNYKGAFSCFAHNVSSGGDSKMSKSSAKSIDIRRNEKENLSSNIDVKFSNNEKKV